MALCGSQSPWWKVPCEWAFVAPFRNGLRDIIIEATIFPELVGSLASIERYNELPWWHYYSFKTQWTLDSEVISCTYVVSSSPLYLVYLVCLFYLCTTCMWKASLVNSHACSEMD